MNDSPQSQQPRVLMVSEYPLTTLGSGPSVTLANLMSAYDPDHVMCMVPEQSCTTASAMPPWDQRTLCYAMPSVPTGNAMRYLRALMSAGTQMSASAIAQQHAAVIQEFAPDVLLSVPYKARDINLAVVLAQAFNLPVALYITDDWLSGLGTQLLEPTFRPALQWLMAHAPVRFMISHALSEEYIRRFGPGTRPDIVVHNPTDMERFAPPRLGALHHDPTVLTYTGSVYPMHLDALVSLARAVEVLRKDGRKVVLRIHTGESFWKDHGTVLENAGAQWGGRISEEDYPRVLKEADWLVIPCAFDDKWQNYTRYTLQTKMAEYLSTGRPVMVVGPAHSAHARWLGSHGAGAMLCSPEPHTLAQELATVLDDASRPQQLGEAALTLVAAEHSREVMIPRFMDGLVQAASSRQDLTTASSGEQT